MKSAVEIVASSSRVDRTHSIIRTGCYLSIVKAVNPTRITGTPEILSRCA